MVELTNNVLIANSILVELIELVGQSGKEGELLMKKKLFTTIAALTLSMICTLPVMADTVSYSFKFNSTSGYLSTNSGYKNDNEQNYYLTISSGNVSSTNIFGTRIRKAADNAAVSPYVKHTSLEQSKKYAYSSSVNTSTLYYMRGKKDDSSTSSDALEVRGRVTY